MLDEERLKFQINVELSDFQLRKLRKFSDSVNDTDAAIDAADVTHILKSMFQESSFVPFFPNEPVLEKIGKMLNLADHLLLIWVRILLF